MSTPTSFSPSDIYPDWGYFPKYVASSSAYKDAGIYEGKYYNFVHETGKNIVSYVPILNIFVGIIRLWGACSQRNSINEKYKAQNNMAILRGVCDIFLGPLNAIIDLIVTLARVKIAHSSGKPAGWQKLQEEVATLN